MQVKTSREVAREAAAKSLSSSLQLNPTIPTRCQDQSLERCVSLSLECLEPLLPLERLAVRPPKDALRQLVRVANRILRPEFVDLSVSKPSNETPQTSRCSVGSSSAVESATDFAFVASSQADGGEVGEGSD